MTDHTASRSRVWGIGLTRTGTTSLAAALRRLGYRCVHWPTTASLMYGNVESATDEPVAVLYKYLDCRFPGSLFILTERNEDDWLRSAAAHRATDAQYSRLLLQHDMLSLDNDQRHRWVETVFTQTSLYGGVDFDEARFRSGFRQHYAAVERYFAGRQDLLRLRICEGEGWHKLCRFLAAPLPTCPFPNLNGRKRDSGL